jgi:hypothetical protein
MKVTLPPEHTVVLLAVILAVGVMLLVTCAVTLLLVALELV